MDKICIIYWGLIRGFKYDSVFNTHKKYIYDSLKQNDIEFDVYIITCNSEFDKKNIEKIPEIKLLKILDISDIHNSEKYINCYKNIKYETNGWNDTFQKNIITLYFSKQEMLKFIPKNYKKYISLDIAHVIVKFDIINCLSNNDNDDTIITSSYETSNGINPRLTIGSYKCLECEYNIFNFILNSSLITIHNPEIFLYKYYLMNNIKVIQNDMIKILRIRSNGLNENGIKIIDMNIIDMNILIVSPYFNNSHFIEIQLNSFRKYLHNCEWKLLVIDDSNPYTFNALTNQRENILNECNKFKNEVIYHKFPEEIHIKNNSNGATLRHCDVLNYIVKNISSNFKENYDYMFIVDADLCFIDNYDPMIELLNYDIIGPKRIQWLSKKQIDDAPLFEYLWLTSCFFNLKTITNLPEMNLNQIPNTTTDTGAMMLEFLHNNPQYKIKYMQFSTGNEYIEKIHFFEFFDNNRIIHFGSGSLWHTAEFKYKNQTYADKIEQFKFLVNNGLTEEDKLNIKIKYEEKWLPFQTLFFGKKYTEDDLRKYKFNIRH